MKRLLVVALVLTVALMGCAKKAAPAAKVQVRWFVGLGAGSDEPTFAPQKAFVEKYNASQNEVELVLEIVDNVQAYNTLATQISGGNAPDIVGPIGIKGRDSFKGAWLDLAPLVAKQKLDLTQFDSKMIDFYRDPGEGLIGLPFGIYPFFTLVNKDLFKEAGLPLPPTKYGDPYIDENGKSWPWDIETVKMLAMKLSVDANGRDATDKKFDATKQVQWGFGEQWTDARGWATLWGAGSFVDANGKAQIPANWLTAFQWIHDGMWKSNFIPNGPYGSSDILSGGDWFASGKVAMVPIHLWYLGFAKFNFDWDLAPVPAVNGVTTAKMHADTFEITKQSKVPDAAFKALTYMVTTGALDLLKIYGGMPAQKSLQADYLKNFLAEKFPGAVVNADLIPAGVAYADNPNHESWMPSFQETSTRYTDFWNILSNEPKADIAAEAAKMKADMDAIYAAAAKK